MICSIDLETSKQICDDNIVVSEKRKGVIVYEKYSCMEGPRNLTLQ